MTWTQCIGVLAFVLNVWGNLELTKVSNRGHMIRLCSNACWIVYAPLVGAWALLMNHCTFAGINWLGWFRWRRAEQEGRIVQKTTCVDHYMIRCVYCTNIVRQCACHIGADKPIIDSGICGECKPQLPGSPRR